MYAYGGGGNIWLCCSDNHCPLSLYIQALGQRTLELEHLKSDWSNHTSSLTSEHSSSLNSERARMLAAQAEAQLGFEQKKKEMEHAHQAKVGCGLGGQGDKSVKLLKYEGIIYLHFVKIFCPPAIVCSLWFSCYCL